MNKKCTLVQNDKRIGRNFEYIQKKDVNFDTTYCFISYFCEKLTLKLRRMERRYSVELIEEHEKVNFYSIHLDGEELSELERFFDKFPEGCEYDEEVDTILAWIDKIAEKGALERYFRPEGRYGDGVGVIPIDVGNKIRLYCLRLTDKVLIFGNGGVKDSDSCQNSKVLAPYVQLLTETSRFVKSRLRDGKIILMDKELIGNLDFVINEKE